MSSPEASSSKAATSAAAEKDYKLLLAIIKQADIKKIDFQLVAQELGLDKDTAARMRWTRFKKAHNLSSDVLGKDEDKASKVTKSSKTTPTKAKAVKKGKSKEKNVKQEDELDGDNAHGAGGTDDDDDE